MVPGSRFRWFRVPGSGGSGLQVPVIPGSKFRFRYVRDSIFFFALRVEFERRTLNYELKNSELELPRFGGPVTL